MGYDESHRLIQQPRQPIHTITCYMHTKEPSQDCAVCMDTSTPKDCPIPMTTANYHKIIERSDELLHELLGRESNYKSSINKLEAQIVRLTNTIMELLDESR